MQDSGDEKKAPTVKDLASPIVDRLKEAKEELVITHKTSELSVSASREKYRRKVICYLKAIGFKNRDIKSTLGCSLGEVYKVLKSQSAQEEIERIQREIFVNEPAKMFEAILPEAIKVAVNAMMSKKVNTSIRVDAAFKFMDRALGKPTQTVEHKTNLVRELITKVNESNASEQPLDAEFFVVQNNEENKGTK